MIKLFCAIALAAGLGGCVVAQPYGYAPSYGYAAPAYYAPPVSIGIGVGGHYGHGWR